ncbi:MAG: CARDB domain-containing protein [Bacteroidota bacterium]
MNSITTHSLFRQNSFFLQKAICCLLLFLLVFQKEMHAQACTNLLANESFETGLDGWTTTGDVTTGTAGVSGTGSARFCANGQASLSQVYPAQEGMDYTASIWAKMEGETNPATVILRFLDANYSPLSANSDQYHVMFNHYQVYYLKGQAPAGAAFVHLLLWKNGDGCLETDDWELCQGGAPVLPDVSVNQLTVTPGAVEEGDTLTVDFWIANFGTANLNGVYDTKIFLAETPTADQNAVLLASSLNQNLPEGFTTQSTIFPILPAGISAGDYYVVVVLDFDEIWTELNEENNSLAVAIEIMGDDNICQGSLTFNSQAEVNAFNGCAIIDGDLLIQGDDIVDLSPFSTVTEITDGLLIRNTPNLTSLAGFENLVSARRLFFRNMPLLVDLAPLANFSNPSPVHVIIEENGQLSSIAALSAITSVQNILSISGNEQLQHLQGLENLTFVGDQLIIQENGSLKNLDELANLQGTVNDIWLNRNASLKNIDGLAGLTKVNDELKVTYNAELTNLDGLNSIQSVYELVVRDNPMLADCCGILPALENIPPPPTVYIYDNLPGCNNVQEITADCGTNTCVGDLFLGSQADVDNFQGCEIVIGNLWIQPISITTGAKTDIQSLLPLASLKEVTGNIVITNNELLTNLDGLDNITKAGGLAIAINDVLENAEALSSLSGELIYFTISGNPKLTQLAGLEGITRVINSVIIYDNELLENLDGLASLDSVGTTTGVLSLEKCPNLTDITGLENLTYAGGGFRVLECISLQSLDGVQNLQEVGQLVLADNTVLSDISALQGVNTINSVLVLVRNPVLEDCCVFFDFFENNSIGGPVTIQDNADNCSSQSTIEFLCQPDGVDLELSMANSVLDPAIYSVYSVNLTLQNQGGLEATGIRVHFAKPAGVVYLGGDEFVASAGTFNPFGSEEWSVDVLGPGETATLTVNYFLLQDDQPVVYAQVIAANEPDADSTPGNGTPPSVNEDDEANSAPAGPALFPDLQLTNLLIQNSPVDEGATLFYSFDASNVGDAPALGDFSIKAWISTDNNISPDDIQNDVLMTGNYDVGQSVTGIMGETFIPADLPAGPYFLILKIDADEVIDELDLNNNFFAQTFLVDLDQEFCVGNVVLESQAEVDNFSGCTFIVGSLIIQSPNGVSGPSSDIHDLSPLLTLTNMTNGIALRNNDFLTDLHGLENVESFRSLSIRSCDSLTNLDIFSGFSGDFGTISVVDNQLLPNLDGLEGITSLSNNLVIRNNPSLKEIDGLIGVTSIGGFFSILDNPSLTSIEGLSNLSDTDISISVSNCDSLQSLAGFENITSVRWLRLGFNDQLADISALASLNNVDDDLSVESNPLLADCCVLNDLLSSNSVGGDILIQNNGAGCNSTSDVFDNCQPGGVDLELSMEADVLNPTLYSSSPVTVTIANAGSTTATGVVVQFPKPSETVYVGGSEFTVSQGTFNPFGNEEWTVGELAPGAAATIEVHYFYLTEDALTPFAQVVAQNEPDADSSPGNGSCCTPLEDDEATVLINGFNGGGNVSLSTDLSRQRMFFDEIYPNPAKYWVTLDVYSPKTQMALIDFYDVTGRSVHRIEVELSTGQNEVQLDVSDWRSGTYTLIGRGEGHPAYGRFLKVWE